MNQGQMLEETTLSAGSRQRLTWWRNLWAARELLFFLAWRDVLVRYKQTLLGVGWAVFRPIMTTLILTMAFGKVAKISSGDLPYSLLVLSGSILWFYFGSVVGECSSSLVKNASLITKVYFPLAVIPLSVMLVNLVDLSISLVLLIIVLLWFDIGVGWQLVLLPIVFVALALLTVGVGMWLSAINAKYRDVGFIVPFLISMGLYVSPVGFPASVVPDKWRFLYSFNPMVGIIDGFRYSLFGDTFPFEWWTLAYALMVGILAALLGAVYFRRAGRDIVDVI